MIWRKSPVVLRLPPGAVVLEGATVRSEVRGQVGVITLDDECRRNALSARTANGIVAALGALRTDGVRAVVLRAAEGMDVWSAGQDIDELPRGGRDPITYNDPLERLLRSVRTFPAPVLAMVHGSVWGGAFDLVLSCDVLIADETATFAITPQTSDCRTTPPGCSTSSDVCQSTSPAKCSSAPRLWTPRGRRNGWCSDHLVSSTELESFALDLAATMASKSPLAIAVIKEQLRVLTDYQPIAAQVYERVQGLRREVYDSGDYREGLEAFAEKRKPVFRGT